MLKKFRKTSIALIGAGSLVASATIAGTVGAGAAGAAATRSRLAATAGPAAARKHAVGSVAASSAVDFELVLQLRDRAGAQALVDAVSTPGSASYRHYVSSAQWEARFAPTADQVTKATAWLRSEGFDVGAVSGDHITISASGSAAQVEHAFGTSLENYKVNGRTARYATGDLSVPASLAGTIAGAIGVNENLFKPSITSGANAPAATTPAPQATANAKSPYPPATPAFVTAPPCGSYYGQKTTTTKPSFGKGYPNTVPDQVCGYQPAQFRSAYGLTSKNTGAGATVAIVDAYDSATIAQDVTKFYNTYDPSIPLVKSKFIQNDAMPFNDQGPCDASGWLGEEDLDIEAVHTMAPGATIHYTGAKNCEDGLFDAEQNIIDHKSADIITNSWSDDGGDLLDDSSTKTAFDDLYMMADSTGISVLFSSGDDGDDFDLFGASTADYPTSSPLVTAVGGTTLQINAAGQRTGDLGWATGHAFLCTSNVVGVVPDCSKSTLNTWGPVSYDGGSGGFTSYGYREPNYQKGVVPQSLATRNQFIIGPTPTRVEPDISMDADPATGELMGLHETFPNGSVRYGLTRFGGTSLASPLMAGELADVDQAAGGSVGFINPAIYQLGKVKGALDDVVPGGRQGQYRTDFAFSEFGGGLPGTVASFREIAYEGTISYCDSTGNCASRPNTLSTAKGYDSMTGVGSAGPTFVTSLAHH
ncbi:MAG TPA: protease pro-enzyme activation domain-containing protein [Acidimicrobiia bacterium]